MLARGEGAFREQEGRKREKRVLGEGSAEVARGGHRPVKVERGHDCAVKVERRRKHYPVAGEGEVGHRNQDCCKFSPEQGADGQGKRRLEGSFDEDSNERGETKPKVRRRGDHPHGASCC